MDSGERDGDDREHICHLFARSQNEQHVKECLPVVPLSSLSASQERKSHKAKYEAQHRKREMSERERQCETSAERQNEKLGGDQWE